MPKNLILYLSQISILATSLMISAPVQKRIAKAHLNSPDQQQNALLINPQYITQAIPKPIHPISSTLFLISAGALDHKAIKKNPFLFSKFYRNLEMSIRLNPENMPAYLFASAYLASPYLLNSPKKALKLLNLGLKTQPNNFDILLAKASIYMFHLSDYTSAAEILNKIKTLKNAPHGWKFKAAQLEGQLYLKADQYDKAATIFTEMLQKNTEKEKKAKLELLINLTHSLAELHKINRIIADFQHHHSYYQINWQLLLSKNLFNVIPTDTLGYRYTLKNDKATINRESPLNRVSLFLTKI